jgi:membrane associated rhomboid family serine protease
VTPDNHTEFLQALSARRPIFTYIFFAINILIFVLMALAGGSMNEPTLLAFGAKHNAEIAQGQWWRFITPIFIHIGMLHLFFNSYALWMVGPQVERLYGPARFVILYVMTGIAGVYGSYHYKPLFISAGASGAIFGLFGVLLVFGIRYRNSIPPFFQRAVGTGVLPVIAINLFIGFTIKEIDNSAHIAGLLCGGALAALVPFQKPNEDTRSVFKFAQMALLATIVVSFYEVGRNYDGPHLSTRNLRRGLTQFLSAGSATRDFRSALLTAERAMAASNEILQAEHLDELERPKKDLANSIDELRNVPSFDAKADELMSALLRIVQDQYALIQDIQRAGTVTFEHGRRRKEIFQRYQKVTGDLVAWLQTEGPRHGLSN